MVKKGERGWEGREVDVIGRKKQGGKKGKKKGKLMDEKESH